MMVLDILEQREDLKQYGNDRLLLFALELDLEAEDIHTIAATSLTDGSNDKKCDLLYVDRDLGRAIVAQSYLSSSHKDKAPANKASDLNTAIAWILGDDISSLPPSLQSAAKELRSAINDGDIKVLEIWYCHNLPESKNVQTELAKVKETADSYLKSYFPNSPVENVLAHEIGMERLEEWYRAIRVPILVSDSINIPIGDGFEEKGDNWTSYATSIRGEFLYNLFKKYGGQLFSANVRGYLGSRRSDKNINNNIKTTAEEEPLNFYAYNNGLTILVHDFIPKSIDNIKILQVEGLAIVNGAQTTGALGSLAPADLAGLKILARFVKCNSKETVRKVILYNNSQNKIEVSDFRSNDPIQERLRSEFEKIPNATYLGGRRGGDDDAIRRPSNLVPTNTAAQALVSFHQNPNLAYNNKGQIWAFDKNYSMYFNDAISARHLVICYGLLRAIEKRKMQLFGIAEEKRTDRENKQVEFFRQRGSMFMMLAAISKSLEIIFGRAVPDKFALKFKKNISPEVSANMWAEVLRVALAFTDKLMPALENTMKDSTALSSSMQDFVSLIEATLDSNKAIYTKLAGEIEL